MAKEKEVKQEEVKDEEIKQSKKKDKHETVPKAEYDKMQEQFTKALSTAAYYENQGKYYQNEYEKSLKYRSQSVVESLLPVLDGFQFAFKAEPSCKEAANYRVGFEYVYKLLLDALNNEGVEQIIPKLGDKFDSEREQVVETIETSEKAKDNTIAEVLLNGYLLKDRLIRAASVKIYQLKQENKETKEAEQTKDLKN